MSLIDLNGFVVEGEPHTGKLQYWINGDEDAVILEYEAGEVHEGLECCIRVITSNVCVRKDCEERTEAEVYGVPFAQIANFVDAVRGIKLTK
jgi:hypothetical protein